MNKVHLTLVQMDIGKDQFQKNKEKIRTLLQKADPTDFIVLPEMWSVDFDFKNMKNHGKHYDKPLQFLQQLARKYQATVVGGSVPQQTGDKLFNTTFVVNDTGTLQGSYWKMHLVSQNNLEGQIFDSGNRIPKFFSPKTPFGVTNCYDLRFPEIFRGIALNGSEIIFLVAQFPKPLYPHWITLLKARAIENQVYIAAVNRVGTGYFGHSAVVDPRGEILLEGDSSEELLQISIDLDRVKKEKENRNDLSVINEHAYNKWVYPHNFIGVGGLMEVEDKVLMVKQNYGRLKGMWLMPGGHLDKGEKLNDGVEREVFEETQIKGEATDIIAIRSNSSDAVVDCYIVFKMEYIEGNPKPDGFENTDARFFTKEEIMTRQDVAPLAAEIIQYYFENKERGFKERKDFASFNDDYTLYT